ncbi:hypothetical protein CANARDRAFT_236831 [[Candida] arabinofermentans NRRL YB-2248]|uniref:Protein kinase domain-containing protein n=1 Tax=[Candida] arabinofermentans NRRL YB-2248 TaxID=983967 RepID=A0A1E4SWW9_9ASCO|nr:hypothetical protein CANARDRAFT_236831 [[Candida] arabinofermentans NRRL YB-2248]
MSEVESEKNDIENGALSPSVSKPLELNNLLSDPIEASVIFTPDNPYHPQNWPIVTKYLVVIVYCSLQVFVTLTSTTYVAVEYMVEERWGVNAQVATLGQSMFILGTAIGPAFLGPLSDIGGRKWVYVVSIFFYTILNFGCAYPLNMPMLAIFMFLIGLAGSTSLSNVAGSIGDLFGNSDGASQPMALFVFSANAGPSIGGVVGEAIAENTNLSFKWVFLINIIIGAAYMVALSFVPETLPRLVIPERISIEGKSNVPNVVIREFKYALQSITGKKPDFMLNDTIADTEDPNNAVTVQKMDVLNEMRFILVMALKMMCTEPIIIFLSLFNGFAYGLLFLYLDGIFDVFVYNNGLSYMSAELTYLNFVVGVSVVICLVPIQTYLFKRDRLKNGGIPRPEARFKLSLVTVWGFPISLLWFAFTCSGNVSYWSPIVAGFVLGIADPLLWLAMLNYIIDSYVESGLSNSAIAAFTIPSFAIAAALAHAGVAMFENMSTKWGFATLGFISIFVVVLVYVFYFLGHKLRASSKLARITVLTGLQQMSIPSRNTLPSQEHSRLASRLSSTNSHQRLPSLSSLPPPPPPTTATTSTTTINGIPNQSPRQYSLDLDSNQNMKRHQSETLNTQQSPINGQFRNPWFQSQPHSQSQSIVPPPNERLPSLNTNIPLKDQLSPLLMQTPTKSYNMTSLPTTFEYDDMSHYHHHHQNEIIPPHRSNAPPPPRTHIVDDLPRRQSIATGFLSNSNHNNINNLNANNYNNNYNLQQPIITPQKLYTSAPRFKKLSSNIDLHPINNTKPKFRRASSSTSFVSPLNALTLSISITYSMCRPEFDYKSSKNPRRVLTKPNIPKSNNGNDNEDSDYILYVNDILGTNDSKKYMVLDILGQGTFGQVVKCQNLKTQEIVAIKVVKSQLVYLNQSLTEANILEHLNKKVDPNDEHHFLRMYDKFIHKNHLCLVFELLSSNLYDLIRQNQFHGLTIKLIKKFSIQLLDSLCILKDAKIIHCDLKPENILLISLDKPNLKVIDFGSACHERQIIYTYIQSRFYRSPEVILGLSYTSSVDMWSFGCIIAELFLGLPLFPGTSEFNQLTRIIEMLGMPSTWMIEMGKNSLNFFNQIKTGDGKKNQYSLKSIEQYSKEFNLNEDPGKNYFNSRYLDDIIMNYKLPKKNMSQLMIDRELQQRKSIIHFLKGVLNLNPLERWTPHEASLHPFVTDQPFNGYWSPPGTNYNSNNNNNNNNNNYNNNSGRSNSNGGLNDNKKQRSKSFGQ